MNGPADNSPRPVNTTGRGPVVNAEHHMTLPIENGMLRAGFIGPHYRPFPPGATVVLNCGSSHVMHVAEAGTLGHALAHCASVTFTGTSEYSERGHVDDYGLIHGLDAIANVVSRAASALTLEMHR